MASKKPGIVLLVAFVSVFSMAQSASAAPCSDQIEALKNELNTTHCSYGKRKRCRGLNRKLDRVVKKLERGNFRRASRKLSNFGMVIERMTFRRKNPRMTVDDFNNLAELYVQADACISSGGAAPAPEVVEPAPVNEPDPSQDLFNE